MNEPEAGWTDAEIAEFVNPKRAPEEEFEVYKLRRKTSNKYLKLVSKGKIFWGSRQQGTYKREKPANGQ